MFSKINNGFLFAVLATLMLAGCSGGVDTANNNTPPVMINSDSGTLRSGNGRWISCYKNGTTNRRDELIMAGSTITQKIYTNVSSATYPSCAIGGTFSGTNDLTASNPVDQIITGGWLTDPGYSTTAAPAKASTTGTLATNPLSTVLTLNGSSGPTAIINLKNAFFIDDSAAGYRLYNGTETTSCPLGANGNPVCLFATKPYLLFMNTGGAPTISSFTPASAAPGASITITGSNFDTTAAYNEVTFSGGGSATVTSATATSLVVTVPATALTGSILITTTGGSVNSSTGFTVTPPLAPSISTTLASPTVLGLNTTRDYTLASGANGYLDIPDVAANGRAYGIYITNANPTLTAVSQTNSTVVVFGAKTVTPALTSTAGIAQPAASAATYTLGIIGDSNTAAGFTATIQEGVLGGQTTASPTAIQLATSTWIGATFNNGIFGPFAATAAGNVVATLTNLTIGVNVTVLDSTGTVVGSTVTSAVSDRTFTATLPVTTGGTYYLWISDQNSTTNTPVVGQISLTMP